MEGDNRRGKKIADHTPHMRLESAAASKAKIPETNGPCLWSMLHVCHLYGHKMTSDQLYPTWRCFYSSTSHSASLSVCVCVASASANPWSVSSPPVPTIVCSFLSLFLSLLSVRIRWKKIIITTSDLKWIAAEVLMFCLWLQRWHWRCDLAVLRGSANGWWALHYK